MLQEDKGEGGEESEGVARRCHARRRGAHAPCACARGAQVRVAHAREARRRWKGPSPFPPLPSAWSMRSHMVHIICADIMETVPHGEGGEGDDAIRPQPPPGTHPPCMCHMACSLSPSSWVRLHGGGYWG
jgi:hypothetical protein